MKKLLVRRESALIIIILIIIIINGIISDNFFTLPNLTVIFVDISLSAIIAAGITLVLIVGEIDISIGANFAFLGMFLGMLLKNGVNMYLSITSTIILGGFIGFLIGFLITKFKIDSFVLTLGALFMLEGLSFVLGYNSKAAQQYSASFGDFPANFLKISTNKFFGLEHVNFYMVIIVFIIGIFLYKNVFFRNLFYVGGNRKSARLLGIKNNFIIIFCFVSLSVLVAISAVLRVSRYNAAPANVGGMVFTLKIITAAIVGGCALSGGRGSIVGTFLGIILFSILNNGLNNIGVSPIYFNFIIGVILVITLVYEKFLSTPTRKSLG